MNFFKTRLSNSFIDLTKGHLASQVIGGICSIAIAKIYGADALGVFSVFFTATMILSTFNTLRFECVLFLQPTQRQNSTVGLVLVVLTTTALLMLVSQFLPNYYLKKWFMSKEIMYVVFMSAFLKSIIIIFQNSILIVKDYRAIKISKILFTVVRYLMQFSFFLFVFREWGLIAGYFVGLIVLVAYLFFKLNEKKNQFSFSKFKKVILQFKDVIFFAFPADLINAVSLHVFPVVLISLYSDKIAGYYFMAFLVLSIPLTFLQSVISPVFFQKTVDLIRQKNNTELYSYTVKIVKRVFVFISVPLLIFVFLGQEIVVFFFEETWRDTGVFLEIFSILFACRVLYSPISSLEESLHKNHISLIVNIYFVIVLFASVYLGKNYFTIFQIAICISILTSMGYAFMLLYFLRLLHKKVKTF